MRLVGGCATGCDCAGSAFWRIGLGHRPRSRRGVQARRSCGQRGGVLAGRICSRGVRRNQSACGAGRSAGGMASDCRAAQRSRWRRARRARCCRQVIRWKMWLRICSRRLCSGLLLRRGGQICCGWRREIGFISRIARPCVRCFRFCCRWSASTEFSGVALSGAGPAVLAIIDGEERLAAASAAVQNQLVGELLICRFSRLGAYQTIEK